MTENICYLPATEMASKIRRGALSPVEVMDAHLARIDERDDEVNAFVTVCNDEAREAAKDAEEAVDRGDPLGPLHGIPVAIKDLTNVKGVRKTSGSKLLADNIAQKDAIEVERLKDAGAIVIGKTNTPEFGRKPMTTNYVAGVTGNPWNSEKTVAGSSGGSAAAVAEGMAPLAQGGDAAGSIRAPASFCGVYGLMADFGRVPMATRPDVFVNSEPYTFHGPIARTVEDAALMLDVTAGYDARDPFSLDDTTIDYTAVVRRSVERLDVAYSPNLGMIPVEDEILDVVDGAVEALRFGGANVERVDPDWEHSWDEMHDALEVILQIRFSGMEDSLKDQGIDLLANRDDVSPEVISRLEKAQGRTGLELRRAERVRTEVYDVLRRFFESYDLLISPTLSIPPFQKNTQPSEINDEPIDPLHGWMLTWPFNLTGNPAASVPAGFTEDGLPVGLQVVGPVRDDETVVAASAALERLNSWHNAYPPRR